MSAVERTHKQEPKYRELIRITEQVVTNARQVVEKAKAAAAGAGDLIASLSIDSLRNEITGYCQLADRVIDRAAAECCKENRFPPRRRSTSSSSPTPI